MPRPREQFFSLPLLLVIGGLMALVLYILFPRQAIFEDTNYLDHPDGLSIAYLDVLLQSDPGNQALRINFARMLGEVGQIRRAERVLEPLLSADPVPPTAYADYLHLLARQLFDLPPGAAREAARAVLFHRATGVLQQDYSFTRKQEILKPVVDWLTPRQSLKLLKAMLAQAPEPDQQLALARQVAHYQEARGDPGAAATTLKDRLGLVYTASGESLVAEIIRLQLAAGQPRQALDTFKTYLANDQMGETGLRQGIRLAQLAGEPGATRRWLEQLARLVPDNLTLQRQLLAAELATGRVAAALDTARRLQRHPAQLTMADQRQVARILEWNQRPGEALDAWQALYLNSGDREAYTRARTLAAELLRWADLRRLLEHARQTGPFSVSEYEQLADVLVRQGDIRTARQRLQAGLAAHPGSTRLIQRDLVLALNTRDFRTAIALLESRPDRTDTERVQLANLYWRTRQPERALALLMFEPEDPELAQEVQVMRIDLALMLGKTDVLKQDYKRLMATAVSNTDPTVQDRLLTLSGLFGDYRHALDLSRARFKQTGDVRYLAAMAEYQLTLEAWPGLAKTLRQWRASDPESRQAERYWTLLALLRQHRGNIAGADQAFQQAFRLAPENEDVLVSWAWLKIANRDTLGNTLPALLARLSRDPGPAAYPVLAFGYSALDQPWVARYWFTRGLDTHGDDPDWLLATAQTLERTDGARRAEQLWARLSALDATTTPDIETRLALYQARGRDRLARRTLTDFLQRHPRPDGEGIAEALANRALALGNAPVAEAMLPALSSNAAGRVRRALWPGQETRRAQAHRLTAQLDQLSVPASPDSHRTTLDDAIALHQVFARSLQTGSHWQDLGNFSVVSSGLTATTSTDRFNLQASIQSRRATGRGRLRQSPSPGTETTLALSGGDPSFGWRLSVARIPRYQTSDTATAAEGSWRADDSLTFTAGLSLKERTPDSAEAWWLTRRNRYHLATTYTPFSRLTVSADLERYTVENVEGRRLGQGHGIDLSGTYSLFRNDPAWQLSAGYRDQQLSPNGPLPAATLNALDRPLASDELLSRRYQRIGLSSRWLHGEPGAIYRSTPSPRALLELEAGYTLSTATPDLGVTLGLGWRVLGDDELALTGRWLSAGLGGKSRTSLNLDYTIYFGR